MPAHFSMTLLMALYIFLREKVDVVVLEVGIGGEFDASNFVRRPVACGITSLHVEHADELGNTVGEIAWHKSGIAKKGTPLFTVLQPNSALEVILARAQKRECPVYLAQRMKEDEIGLGIAGERQTINAGLALQLCRVYVQFKEGFTKRSDVCNVTTSNVSDIPVRTSSQLTPEETRGLLTARLPGRAQIVKVPGITYYLDGAHTTESMQQCVAWYTEASKKEREQLSGKNIQQCLVYRMKKDKNASNHLPFLTDIPFRRAGFCPYVVSTTARHQFPDNMDLTEDVADAQKLAETHLDCWNRLQAKRVGHLKRQQMPVNEEDLENIKDNHNLAHLLESLENKMGLQESELGLSHSLQILETGLPQPCPENHLNDQIRTLEMHESGDEKEKQDEGDGDRCAATPCESHCFTSIVSALWWAGLGKDPNVQSLAVADLEHDPKQQKKQDFIQYVQKINGFNPMTVPGKEVVTDATDVDHVQVLVTGSVALVGGVLSLIKPDLWE